MQNPQPIRTGDLVRVRRQRWRVADVRAYEHCRLLTLIGIGTGNGGLERRFLLPFETVGSLDPRRPGRVVRPRLWRRACRALLADCAPPGSLRAARLADIDLLPHQLEPALAAIRGRGSRFLLADDVGLGKTIQAGLAIVELRARGGADRVLVLTPAGLREQWAGELSDRFGIVATVVDARDMRTRTAMLPVGLNPWSTVPVVVASTDYVKRADVLPSLLACRWDILVVDEAHGAAGASDRHAAVSALALRASYVFLLSATPHNGDERAFNALCRIGAQDDSLLVFRRSRADVGLGARRRVHQLRVRLSAAEARMHALLEDFSRAVRAEHDSSEALLALSVLHKRGLSSASSLERSVGRRLAALGADDSRPEWQLELPLADPGGEFDRADEAPELPAFLALRDARRERQMLLALQTAAREASLRETKIAAIARLLRRVAEPIVIFTEFRDTLLHVLVRLKADSTYVGETALTYIHGGLTREERRRALEDFVSGRRRVLLATDAAGEGLNLHQRCRVVVNLELPWNPMRLEQRIGRVDRIGQRRAVHVFHLIARADAETAVLERLKTRIARAREDIAVANPLENDRNGADGERQLIRLEKDAAAEADRLAFARRLSSPGDAGGRSALEASGPWLTTARASTTRIRLDGRAIALLRIDYEDGHGRVPEWTLVPFALGVDRRETNDPDGCRRLLRGLESHLSPAARAAAAPHRDEVARVAGLLGHTRAARDAAIARAMVESPRAPVQPGLFDRRIERTASTERALRDAAGEELSSRQTSSEKTAVLSERPPQLLLVLAP